MTVRHLGELAHDDPLYRFLTVNLGDRIPRLPDAPTFDVWALDDAGTVFRYRERKTAIDLVGKFYGHKWLYGRQSGMPRLRARLMRQEFQHLAAVRALGFDGPPHWVVRPIATSEAIDCLVLMEYAAGRDLHSFIYEAAVGGRHDDLYDQLRRISAFLADLHMRSGQASQVDQDLPLAYLSRMCRELTKWDIISGEQRRRLRQLRDAWASRRALDGVGAVLIHGDATPTNFVFCGGDGLAVIDLERLSPSDGAADLGRLAAELKHLFWWYSGDLWASEGFIRALYADYRCLRGTAAGEPAELTDRGRYYMGCDLLRISRNIWLDLDYRRTLIEEAIACLES